MLARARCRLRPDATIEEGIVGRWALGGVDLTRVAAVALTGLDEGEIRRVDRHRRHPAQPLTLPWQVSDEQTWAAEALADNAADADLLVWHDLYGRQSCDRGLREDRAVWGLI